MIRSGKMTMTIILAVLSVAATAVAQEMSSPPPALAVDQYAFCGAVEDHQPVNSAESFSADAGKVYLWTAILNPGAETEVTHVWYRGDTKVAEVSLAVRYSRTRTWSVKTILPAWTGPWHVDVVDTGGNVLGSYAFTITEAME